MPAVSCSSLINDIIPHCPANIYRFFNQPIEQIPGWDSAKVQVLVHKAAQGLIWQNVYCEEVVTCIRLDSNTKTLKIDRKKIVAINTLDSTETTACPGISTTTCSSSS